MELSLTARVDHTSTARGQRVEVVWTAMEGHGPEVLRPRMEVMWNARMDLRPKELKQRVRLGGFSGEAMDLRRGGW